MAIERLAAGLAYERSPATSTVVIQGEPVLRLGPVEARVRVDLVLPGADRAVEVSFHPATADGVVRERARRFGADPNAWTGSLARALRVDAARWSVAADASHDLLRVLGAMAHPVLAQAYAGGAATVEEVPRWAAPALRSASVREAAAALFGSRGTTRTVVRATATALAALPASWWAVALAAAAARVVEPDDLVRGLDAGVGSVAPPPASPAAPPSGDAVRAAAAGLRLVGRERAARLVVEAVSTGTAPRLVAVLRLLVDVQRDVRWPVPATRAELERVCLLAAAIDPDPGPRRLPPHPIPPAPTREVAAATAVATAFPGARPVVPPPVAPAVPPDLRIPRRAPEVRTAPPPSDRSFRHGELARALAVTASDGRYDVVLPRTGAELTAWARLLGNCLGDFSASVACGATIVVGIRQQGVLVAAGEIRERQLVQLLGARNRPVPPPLATAVSAHVAAVVRRVR